MQHGTPGLSWAEWLEANGDRDDATKLAALREYIALTGRTYVGTGNVSADWVNKKLAKLGVAERITSQQAYGLTAPVNAELDMTIYATSRADALKQAEDRLNTHGAERVRAVTAAGPLVFTSGPEDVDPDAVDPDAPTTVADTLTKLREYIMLGHISGPKYCKESADEVLEEFGLDPIPPRRQFVVTRPVQAVMRTVVEAYDEESAERVAGWRWEDGRTSFETSDAVAIGGLAVHAN